MEFTMEFGKLTNLLKTRVYYKENLDLSEKFGQYNCYKLNYVMCLKTYMQFRAAKSR